MHSQPPCAPPREASKLLFDRNLVRTERAPAQVMSRGPDALAPQGGGAEGHAISGSASQQLERQREYAACCPAPRPHAPRVRARPALSARLEKGRGGFAPAENRVRHTSLGRAGTFWWWRCSSGSPQAQPPPCRSTDSSRRCCTGPGVTVARRRRHSARRTAWRAMRREEGRVLVGEASGERVGDTELGGVREGDKERGENSGLRGFTSEAVFFCTGTDGSLRWRTKHAQYSQTHALREGGGKGRKREGERERERERERKRERGRERESPNQGPASHRNVPLALDELVDPPCRALPLQRRLHRPAHEGRGVSN